FSGFLPAHPFLRSVGFISCPRLPAGFAVASLSAFAACDTFPNLALSPFGGLIARDNRLASRGEFEEALRLGPTDPLTGLPFGFQQVFIRGDAQTNTVVRLGDRLFSKTGDIRSSMCAGLLFYRLHKHCPA